VVQGFAGLGYRSRSSVFGLLLLALGGAACGGGTTRGAPGVGGTGGGSSGGGQATGGSAGGPAPAGEAGQGESGPEPYVPGATPEEGAILDPLFWDSARLQNATLQELVELGSKIGLARGYALCRCAITPEQPPESVAYAQASCARDEAGLLRNFTWYPSAERGPRANEDLSRCLVEERAQAPWLESTIRCELERYQRDGRNWLELCAVPHAPNDSSAWPGPAAEGCSNVEGLSRVLETCLFTGYCADGTRASSGRCSGSSDCPNAFEERGCFDFVGFDMLQCGDEITQPQGLCSSTCGYETTPPLCDEARRDRFLCADGTDVDIAVVCDRKNDCADGTDERYCLR